MRALVLNCTLKPSLAKSNTEALARVVMSALEGYGPQRVLERMDALLTEQDVGVVVTGNEDGAHHVISEIAGALIDVGYTIPGQAWTYGRRRRTWWPWHARWPSAPYRRRPNRGSAP